MPTSRHIVTLLVGSIATLALYSGSEASHGLASFLIVTSALPTTASEPPKYLIDEIDFLDQNNVAIGSSLDDL